MNTAEDFRIQFRGPLANYVCGYHVTPVRRGALGYVSYQKGIILGHLVHRYAPRKVAVLCPRIVFRDVLTLDVSTQSVFSYYMSVKYTLKHYFLWCLWCQCYALAVMSNKKINTIFNPSSVIYMGHRRILLLLLIFIYCHKHANTKVSGSKCIANKFLCIIWMPKANFFYQNVHIT